MKFVSLADPTDKVSFEEAIYAGFARDGKSLYMPEVIPELQTSELVELAGACPNYIGHTMLRPYVSEDIDDKDLMKIVATATSFDMPLVEVGNKQVLELTHGPTMAFKDVAAGYLGAIINHFNEQRGERSNIVVATSGDTGGAIAHGFADMPSVGVVVVYPKGRVSKLQEEQMRRVAANVHAVEVNGTFDDCLKLTESAFADKEIRNGLNLTTANSVNIGRMLPQTVYYAGIYSRLVDESVRVTVPTGNLGNLSAGVLAKRMGVPIKNFLAANNENDVLNRYISSGQYETRGTVTTMSNAMDIGAPKNAPRFLSMLGNDINRVRDWIAATKVDDQETVAAIREVYDATGYVLDPHTAVAWRASEKIPTNLQDVIVSTASPVKFANEIYEATGIAVDNDAELAALRTRSQRFDEIDNSEQAFKDLIAKRLG